MGETLNHSTYIPIYTSRGDTEAYLVYPYLFNHRGEWIGFVTRERDVYSVYGNYVGWLSNEPRILCKRSYSFDRPRLPVPLPPQNIRVPALGPLAPMMAELGFDTIDVLNEEPDRLPSIDGGEKKKDLD